MITYRHITFTHALRKGLTTERNISRNISVREKTSYKVSSVLEREFFISPLPLRSQGLRSQGLRDFTSASVEYNCKMLLLWNNGNHMEELPDILLLGELYFPNSSSKKSNSKPLLSSCLSCRVNQVYKWVCMQKHKSCPTHRVGGAVKKAKSICFCKPIPALFVNVSFYQKKLKIKFHFDCSEEEQRLWKCLWSRDQPAILPG